MDTKYTKIPPTGMFTVTVGRSLKQDTSETFSYEYSFKVEAGHSENDFINLFVKLVVAHGKRSAATYAAMMGVSELQLTTTLLTLSGVGILEWTDTYAGAIAEKLLLETKWQVKRVAKEAGFSSQGVFGKFFYRRYGYSPSKWRWRKS